MQQIDYRHSVGRNDIVLKGIFEPEDHDYENTYLLANEKVAKILIDGKYVRFWGDVQSREIFDQKSNKCDYVAFYKNWQAYAIANRNPPQPQNTSDYYNLTPKDALLHRVHSAAEM